MTEIRIDARTRQAFPTWNDLSRQLLDAAILVELRGAELSGAAIEEEQLGLPGPKR